MRIVFYLQPWHLKNSPAFDLLLIERFRQAHDCVRVEWDGTHLPRRYEPPSAVHVFCQLPPPPEFAREAEARVVWIPMWDHIQRQPEAWWRALSRNLRILAFSGAVESVARRAGLPTLRLKFHMNPAACPAADWSGPRVLMYWNRRGLISTDALQRLCADLRIDTLLWRRKLDPQVSEKAWLKLGTRFGNTEVVRLPAEMERGEYLGWLAQANILIAPRRSEGAGLVMQEALARGCCVLAWDAATMNEYIESGKTGFLFREQEPGIVLKNLRRVQWHWEQLNGREPDQHYFPVFHADQWAGIEKLDLAELGRAARREHKAGYRQWETSIPALQRFLTHWEAQTAARKFIPAVVRRTNVPRAPISYALTEAI